MGPTRPNNQRRQPPPRPTNTPHPSAQALWARALDLLPWYMERRTFDHWLRGTQAIALEGDCLVVEVWTARAVAWLENRLSIVIDRALAVYLPGIKVRFVAPATPTPEVHRQACPERRKGAAEATHQPAMIVFEKKLPNPRSATSTPLPPSSFVNHRPSSTCALQGIVRRQPSSLPG